MFRCRRKQGSGAQETYQRWRETGSPQCREILNQLMRLSRVHSLSAKIKQLGPECQASWTEQKEPRNKLRRSDQNAEKKNKTVQYFRSQEKKGRAKGGQQCVKFCGQARLRTKTCLLDLATKTSIVTLVRAGLVNRCEWNQAKILGLKQKVRNGH